MSCYHPTFVILISFIIFAGTWERWVVNCYYTFQILITTFTVTRRRIASYRTRIITHCMRICQRISSIGNVVKLATISGCHWCLLRRRCSSGCLVASGAYCTNRVVRYIRTCNEANIRMLTNWNANIQVSTLKQFSTPPANSVKTLQRKVVRVMLRKQQLT